MAGLRADVKAMRDVPTEASGEAPNAFAQYIDSLPEERSFMDKLKGSRSLEVGNPQDIPKIATYMDSIRQGQLDEARLQKLIRRNPGAAGAFATAFDDYKRASSQQGQVKGIYSTYFKPGEQLPPDQAGPTRPPTSDYEGAMTALNALGPQGAEQAKALAEQIKLTRENNPRMDRAPTSYELAARANGQSTGHPLVDSMSPKQAATVLQTGAPLTMATGFDANGNPYPVAFPRGVVPGMNPSVPNQVPGKPQTPDKLGPGGIPLSPSKVKEIPEKINDTANKLGADLQTINLILSATNPDATQAEKEALSQKGIKWDPNAVGAKGLQPEFMLQRTDPQGVGVRAAIADFSADKIHERYAGNLTGGEIKRSQQWAAQSTDSTEALRTKLLNQKRVLENLARERAQTYSPEKGYMTHPVLNSYLDNQPKQSASILPGGFVYKGSRAK